MADSSPKEAATTCSTIHVVLDDMDRDQAIRIVENLLYYAKRGDTMEGMLPGYVCIRPAGVRSPNNPIDRLRTERDELRLETSRRAVLASLTQPPQLEQWIERKLGRLLGASDLEELDAMFSRSPSEPDDERTVQSWHVEEAGEP